MKITIVLGAFLPVPPIMGGAVEKVWFVLAREFARRGHEVVLVSRKVAQFPQKEVLENVRHVRISGFDTPRSLIWLKILDLVYSWRTLSVLAPADVIVTNTFWLPILLRTANRGAVYVHVARFPKWQMRFYGGAARLQAPSQAVARAIAASVPQLKSTISVIPYPAPATGTAPPSIDHREKIILFVGRVHPEKGVHILLEAFVSHARTVFASWRLMIVGPTKSRFGGGGEPYLQGLQKMADQAKDQVTFTGPIFESALLEETFRRARLFIYPSLAESGESFGLAPLEAMTHGCAVLVSNLDCFHDFIRDGETGFLFDHRSNDPGATLQEKIENITANETLLARVAEQGYRKSLDYSVARVADQFLNDFESLARKSHGGTS
ncbi:MAG: hypothetical protein QOI34_1611 [Verrucomicrobiota bacterium]